MAIARLSALGSLLAAAALATLVPATQGVALAALVGWGAVVSLGLGIWFGAQSALTITAVAFVVRIATVSAVTGLAVPPAWIQVFLLVLAIELAVISIESRVMPRASLVSMGRAVLSASTAMMVAIILESAVYGASGGGVLLRIGAVAALVILAGWITNLWWRAVG